LDTIIIWRRALPLVEKRNINRIRIQKQYSRERIRWRSGMGFDGKEFVEVADDKRTIRKNALSLQRTPPYIY